MFNFLQSNKDFFLINGKKVFVPKDMLWSFQNGDYYEENVIFWITEIVRFIKEPVFYDVGANLGYYTTVLASNCKAIYAFEPVSSSFKFLQNNTKKNKLNNVQAFNFGLSDKQEEKKIR